MADDGNESSDAYFSSDEEDLSYVDFHIEVDDNFLNVVDEPVFANDETVVEESENIDPKNDWRKLLVYCGRDVEAGRYAGNYNLGSLVTYRWITHHYAKQLIADPFIPTLKMKTDIWEKFLINVSLGQCKRAKQRAYFDYERGLQEQYGMLWEYRHAILDSNPGSTCRLDDEETESGHYYFKRIYVCFKGVKEGWLAGCRKVIRLDGSFLKHTRRGELLVAMGRDANNQMYPIGWAVVKVEKNEN
ncbi:hypothetical protein Tco_1412687 [Tanacetum coccineum]